MSDILSRLGEIRINSEELRRLEKSDNDAKKIINHLWIESYGEGAIPYEVDFGKLIREKNLKNHIVFKAAEFRKQGKPYCILDLFSPLESFLKKIQKWDEDGNLTIDGGIASTLDDPRRDPKIIKSDERKKLFVVPGDITLPGPRNELRNDMERLGIQNIGFGAIFARPYGGVEITRAKDGEIYIPVYYALFRGYWDLTAVGGEIFCPVPVALRGTETFHKWIDLMKNEVGASVETYFDTNMKITKNFGSKAKLPGLRDLGI